MAVVISTVSTVSEQERNGQGRRDVGKSVHVRQAIAARCYHVIAENCKQSGLQMMVNVFFSPIHLWTLLP